MDINKLYKYRYNIVGYKGEAAYKITKGVTRFSADTVKKVMVKKTQEMVYLVKDQETSAPPFSTGEKVRVEGRFVTITGNFREADGSIVYTTDYVEWKYTENSIKSKEEADQELQKQDRLRKEWSAITQGYDEVERIMNVLVQEDHKYLTKVGREWLSRYRMRVTERKNRDIARLKEGWRD